MGAWPCTCGPWAGIIPPPPCPTHAPSAYKAYEQAQTKSRDFADIFKAGMAPCINGPKGRKPSDLTFPVGWDERDALV